MKKIILISLLALSAFALIITGCDKGDTPSKKLYLFNIGYQDGNLGGRAGADALVANHSNKPAGVTKTAAFLSVDATDQLVNLPAKYGFPTDVPIYGPDGIAKVADNWADLMDGSIAMSLEAAGVLPTTSKGDIWWSGSNSDGTVSASTCSGWTENSNTINGTVGYSSEQGSNWMDDGAQNSYANCFVLGIGY